MIKSNRVVPILLSTLLLTACGGSDNSNESSTGDSAIENQETVIDDSFKLLFPAVDSLASGEFIKVRGSKGADVGTISVNGIEASIITSGEQEYWVASVPIQTGENNLSISYAVNNESLTQAVPTITKVAQPFDYVGGIKAANVDDSYYVYDSDSKSFYHVSHDALTARLIYQVQIEDYPNDHDDGDELHEQLVDEFALSADDAYIYYAIEFESSSYIQRLDTKSGELDSVYSPDSANYYNFQIAYDDAIAMMPNLGAEGQLILLNRDGLVSFNIADNTLSTLLPDNFLNEFSASSKYTAFARHSSKKLSLILKESNKYYSVIYDLQTNDLSTAVELTKTMGCEQDEWVNYHTDSSSFISYDYTRDNDIRRDVLCATNTATGSTTIIEDSFNQFVEAEGFSMSTDKMLFTSEEMLFWSGNKYNNQAVRYTIDNTFPAGNYDYQLLGHDLKVGNASISPRTPREVVIDQQADRFFWIDRNSPLINAAQTHLFDLKAKTLTSFDESGAHSFEMAVYNETDGYLYLFNDANGDEGGLYKLNLNTGVSELVVGLTEEQAFIYNDFTLDSIALNDEQQIIYLAAQVNDSALPSDYDYQTNFILIAWHIQTQQLSIVADLSKEFEGMKASYEMVYDSSQKRVLFYSSETDNPIYAINTETGTRSIFSIEEVQTGPDNSNARGHLIDIKRNRMIASSQDHESLYQIDLDTGIRTSLSPKTLEYGIMLDQPKGLDQWSDTQVGLVADEGLDALYMVDMLTGYRVLIQNQ